MGFLDRLRASQSNTITNWKNLTSTSQLEEIDELSKAQPVIIFKHSTTCGISAGAKNRLESGWEAIPEDATLYYLDLLSYRAVSNAIADRYGVRHESPQIIVIRDGKASYNVSHHAIQPQAIAGALA
ncbi:MAG: bacillithiol system redox-active protein YtxJ [Bacteroidota bacterium]